MILDVVYGFTGLTFHTIRCMCGYRENPFMGSFAKDMFGPNTEIRHAHLFATTSL